MHKEVDNIYTERHCFYTARVTIIKTYYADFMLTENVTLFSIAWTIIVQHALWCQMRYLVLYKANNEDAYILLE